MNGSPLPFTDIYMPQRREGTKEKITCMYFLCALVDNIISCLCVFVATLLKAFWPGDHTFFIIHMILKFFPELDNKPAAAEVAAL